MRKPIFVRPLTKGEQTRLEDGLRSSDSFVLRRCQMLLASARGTWVPQIAVAVGCDDETVRKVIRIFEGAGLEACLTRQSSRPHHPRRKVDAEAAEKRRALVQRNPRTCGKPTSVGTLELAAEVSFAEGITPVRVSDETIRTALLRLGVRWKRAKHWHPKGTRSPDPADARKKARATV